MDFGGIYHVMSRSIAKYIIFNSNEEYDRFRKSIEFYQLKVPLMKFSDYLKHQNEDLEDYLRRCLTSKQKLVHIISYCLMPTHIHLVLEQLVPEGISIFMNNLLNSYSRYFNIKHKRKGPLWAGRFKRVEVKDDGQLIHLTRYLHLNPVTAKIVSRPERWHYSSYNEFIANEHNSICVFAKYLEIDRDSYKSFVLDRINYQRELTKIKAIMFK